MVQQGKKEEREEGRWGGAHTNASSPAAAQNPKSKKIKMFGLNKPYDIIYPTLIPLKEIFVQYINDT